VQVSKWGNSLAIRLPKAVVDELELKEGDEVEIIGATREKIEIARRDARIQVLKGLRKHGERLPAGYKFTRKDAYDEF